MYAPRKIPVPFQNNPKTAPFPPSETPISASVEAKEKPAEQQPSNRTTISPLAALLFLDIFSNKKGDEM